MANENNATVPAKVPLPTVCKYMSTTDHDYTQSRYRREEVYIEIVVLVASFLALTVRGVIFAYTPNAFRLS